MTFDSRRRFRSRGPHAAVAGAVSLSLSLSAAAASDPLRVACPLLDAEGNARLTARLRADLAVREPTGRVVVTCGDGVLWVAWEPDSAAARQEEIQLAQGELPTAEMVLEVVDRLMSASPEPTPEAASPPRSATEPPAPPPEETRSAVEDPDRVRPAPEARAYPERGMPLLLGAGGEAEAWPGESAGMLGPRLSLAIEPARALSVSLSGTVRWGVGLPEELGARALDAAAHADFAALSWLWLGAGVRLTSLQAEQQGPAPASDSTLSPGLALRARAGVRTSVVSVLAGPFLRVRPGATVVEADGREVLRMPAFTLGISADAAFELVRLPRPGG